MASEDTENKKQTLCVAGLCLPLQRHLKSSPWPIPTTHRGLREIACFHSACWSRGVELCIGMQILQVPLSTMYTTPCSADTLIQQLHHFFLKDRTSDI